MLAPRWAWLALVVGLAMLTPAMLTSAYQLLYLLALLWVAALSVRLYRKGRDADAVARSE